MKNDFFEELASKWPSSIVAREKIQGFSGGILHPRTMSNLDSRGCGPEKIKVGRKIAYPVQSLIEWLRSRVVR